MSIENWPMVTAAVVIPQDEAVELYSRWRMRLDEFEHDVTDHDDPEFHDYWLTMLQEDDTTWQLSDDNCSFFEVLDSYPGLEGCGSAVREASPFDEVLTYLPAKQPEGLFHAAYGSVEDIVDEFRDDESLVTCGQSRQWIKDHLAYVSCVMFG